MESLVKYLDCGNIFKKSSVNIVDYEVKNFSGITLRSAPQAVL